MMIRILARAEWAVLTGLMVLLFPVSLTAGAPTESVRVTAEGVLAVLKDPELKSPAKTKERREKLKAIIYPKFDFAEMAKRSLGSAWQRRTEQERSEFVKIFSELLETSYADRIDAYNGEKIAFGRERVDTNVAEVDSKVLTAKGEEYSLNYKLHQVDGNWKIYDVVIENISLVNNYRSQFNRVLSNASFEELLDRLRKKQFQAPAGDGRKGGSGKK